MTDDPSGPYPEVVRQAAALVRMGGSIADGVSDLLRSLCRCTEVDAAVVREVRGSKLPLLAFYGIPEHLVAPVMDAGVGISARLLRGESVAIQNPDTDPVTKVLSRRARGEANHFVFRSYYGVPLVAHDHVIGLLGLYLTERTRDFTEEEKGWVQVIADCIGMALSQRQMARELDEASREFQIYRQERSDIEERLATAPLHDPLTGLALEPLFLDHLARVLNKARLDEGFRFTLGVVRPRRYAIVADTLGPEAADAMVLECLGRLLEAVGPDAIVGRLAPDLFGFVLEQPEREGGEERAVARIRQNFSKPLVVDGRALHVTVQIGLVRDGPITNGTETLLHKAFAAELQAGRETSASAAVVYNPTMHYAERQALEFQADIQRGMEAGEFSLFLQPLIELSAMKAVGAEALLRWNHPDRGLLLPGEFLLYAESAGYLRDLGMKSIAAACAWLSEALAGGTVTPEQLFVTANLAPRQLSAEGSAQMIIDLVRSSGVPPSSLKLEITETGLIGGSDRVVAALRELRDFGLGLWLDDFGQGYSSLGRLHTLPFECIKIDRAFVSNLGVTSSAEKIVSAIANLGLNLGLEVLAEGVENGEQLDYLRGTGIRYAQGFHLARPMPSDKAAALLRQPTLPLFNFRA